MNNARVGYEKQSFNLTPIVFSDEDMMHDVRSTVDEKILNVTLVKNKTSTDTDLGLCWAAAMVSIIRYRAGKSSLTIDSLYNTLKSEYPPNKYGYPYGLCVWTERCFHYIIYHTHIVTLEHLFLGQELLYKITDLFMQNLNVQAVLMRSLLRGIETLAKDIIIKSWILVIKKQVHQQYFP